VPADTAEAFLDRLTSLRDDSGPGRVAMREIFGLAKEFVAMPPDQIEQLLDRPEHDTRVGAVSVMDWQARATTTPTEHRRELYELYLRRHDRIDSWDLVDRSAPSVVGRYLVDKPREQLYVLARSADEWERRTAIVATYAFIRQGDLDDTFGVAEVLVDDETENVQRAVGGWVREAGKRDRQRLLAFLDRHAATMPRTTLRFAIEHLSPDERQHYLGLRKSAAS
jgi:DNA alkylation repair enzyme